MCSSRRVYVSAWSIMGVCSFSDRISRLGRKWIQSFFVYCSFFFLFINEYCSYVFKHLEHEFRESLSKYLAESSYQTSSSHERYLSLDRILGWKKKVRIYKKKFMWARSIRPISFLWRHPDVDYLHTTRRTTLRSILALLLDSFLACVLLRFRHCLEIWWSGPGTHCGVRAPPRPSRSLVAQSMTWFSSRFCRSLSNPSDRQYTAAQ